jgi:LmbE family N-acetylglucosaminyl deacetylase
MSKILVIAPHPDDEVLGCGGTILKHARAGNDVYLCVATKAYTPDWTEDFISNRKREIEKSNEILGIKKTYFLDFPTAKLDTISGKDINEAIGRVIKEVGPETIYIPHSGDLHSDHKIIFHSSLIAARPVYNESVKKILSYEALSETDWAAPENAFNPNIYVDISEMVDDKVRAMQAYQSEVKNYPHSRSLEMIKILAQKRGTEANLKFAEAFLLIREINS